MNFESIYSLAKKALCTCFICLMLNSINLWSLLFRGRRELCKQVKNNWKHFLPTLDSEFGLANINSSTWIMIPCTWLWTFFFFFFRNRWDFLYAASQIINHVDKRKKVANLGFRLSKVSITLSKNHRNMESTAGEVLTKWGVHGMLCRWILRNQMNEWSAGINVDAYAISLSTQILLAVAD